LKDRIEELEAENEALQDHIDSIADIASREDEEEEDATPTMKKVHSLRENGLLGVS
jgi:hypothetical protein